MDSKKILTIGLYASFGLVVGVLVYFGYSWAMSKKAPSLPASGGEKKNAAGRMQSWYCQKPENKFKPECQPAKAASWYCQRPENRNKPECQPAMASIPVAVFDEKFVSNTSYNW